MISDSKRRTAKSQEGFSLPAAIFLLVVLWLLGAFIVSITGTQQSALVLDVQGSRAYQAARAGVEWAAYNVLDPNNTGGAALPSCPASPTTLPALAGSLATYTVIVNCSATTTTEGNRNVRVFLVVSRASSGAPGTPTYVEREVQAVLTKCKDPAAPMPGYECGG